MSRGTILVVDDEPLMREVLRDFLTTIGFEIRTADDGWSALEVIRQTPLDLVLLDIAMPGMDGIETLRQITTRRADLPVVMVTAYDDVNTASQAYLEAAAAYVTKPFNLDALERVVATQIARSRGRETNPPWLRQE
jgi:DNA-binding NtrC family response regulator